MEVHKRHLVWQICGTVLLVILFSFLLATTPGLRAAGTIHYVAPGGTDSPNCSVKTPCLTIQQAITNASNGDEIRVAAGTYTGTSLRAGSRQLIYLNKSVTLRGGFSPANWVEADPEANPTILDAGQNGRVIYVPAGVNAKVIGFTLQNGRDDAGAGVYNQGNLTLEQVIIRNNSVKTIAQNGAGVLSNGGLVLKNSHLYANQVYTNGGGAAVYILGGTFELSGNKVYNHVGQGSQSNSPVRIDNGSGLLEQNEIHHNTMEVAGGIAVVSGTVTLRNNLIYANVAQAAGATYDHGGGIYVVNGQVTLEHNTLAGNQAGERGGGVYISGGTVIINNTLLVNNSANAGANIYAPATGVTISYTDLWPANSYGGGMADPVPGDNNRYSDPLLESDYRLSAASPARDSGNSLVTVDFEGHARPFGAAVDRGADEYLIPSACYARIGDGRVYTTIQEALDNAQAGDTIKIAGACTGVQARNNTNQVVYVDKSITLQGGYNARDWAQARYQPAVINANGQGYGIYAVAGNLRIENLHIINGVGQNGGGLFAASNVYLTVRNSIFANNSATLNGGGVYVGGSGSIEHSVFYANTAGQRGGGLYLNVLQPFTVRNSIFANNQASIRGGGLDFGGTDPTRLTLKYNDLYNNQPDAYGAALPGSNDVSYPPNLVSPATQDYHLSPTSFLVNRADPNAVVSPDYEGDTRPQGAASDIGADERITYAQMKVTPLTAQKIVTNVNDVRGQIVVFNHTLTNEGNTPNLRDSFIITASNSAGWPVSITGVSSPVQLYKGESVSFQVRVQVPTELAEGFDTQTVVRVTSQWSTTYVEAHDTIANSAFTLTPTYNENADPGEVLTYTHILHNLGAADTFSITANSNLIMPWGRIIEPLEPITLTHGQTTTVLVQVLVPGKAAANLQEVLQVQALSLNYGTRVAITDTTTANPRAGDRYVMPTGDDRENNCTQSAFPCKTISHAVGQAAALDKIFVAQGIYRESDTIRISQYNQLLGGYIQDPQTKAFVLPNATLDPATTVIDLQNRARVLLIQTPATDETSMRVRVKGFTLRNGNTGGVGGAIYLVGDANPILEDLIIENCSGTQGGALYIDAGAPDVRRVTIRNTSADRGGAIYVNTGTPLLSRLVISTTTARNGGVLYNAAGTVRLQNTMMYSSTASQNGGALYNGGYLSAIHVTLYGNSAGGYGGAVYDQLSVGLQISNTLVISNVAGLAGGGLYREGASAASMDYNDVWGNQAPQVPQSNIPLGAHSISADPRFVDAANGDLHLRFDSPALDTADPNSPLTEDFEGDPRPANQGYDIGADEIVGCLARLINPETNQPTGKIYTVLQQAINDAPGGYIVQISGRCLGAQPARVGTQTFTQTAIITKSLTLVGGYNSAFNNDPAVEFVPTYFDAQGLGRTLLITRTDLAATVVISDIIFVNGNALRGDPQGLGGGVAVFNQTVLIARSTITNSTARYGGGLYVQGGTVTFGEDTGRSSQVLNNSAERGGGVYLAEGTLTLRGVWLLDNQATDGAGMYVAAGTLDGQRLRLHHNTASGKGGGVYVAQGSSFKLVNASVAQNSAFSGGGLYNLSDALELRHLTVYGNSATTQGGGLYHKSFSATPLINSSIFAGNLAASGSGIYNDGLKPHFDYNNVSNDTLVNLTLADGTGNLALDPLLRTTLAYTDPAYLHLTPGSPMEDRADPNSPVLEDIDGTPRPSNQGFDIGADELGDCYVRINGEPPTYGSVQRAANLAPANAVLHVAGTCLGVNTASDGGQSVTQALFINKALGVQGGYTYTNWLLPPNPAVNITTIDAVGQGRVVYITGNSVVTMSGLHLINGTGTNGAGIYVASGTFTLTQSTLAGNTATNNGGALYVAGGTVAIQGQSVITGNQALRGGGVFNQDGNLLLDSLIIANNVATQHGGAYYHQGGSTRLRNSFIYGNSAQLGGGIYNNSTAPLEVLNNTLYANQASDRGGGMYTLNSLPTLRNTIFATNTAGVLGAALYSAMAYQPDYNAFYPQAGATNPEVMPGPHTVYADPAFVDPATGDLHLRDDSPMFDRGDPQTVLEYDIDGDLRPADQGYDLGADERRGCWARLVRTGKIYANPQLAVYASRVNDEIQITVGECRGVHPFTVGGQVISQTLHVTRNLTLSGGWSRDFAQQYPGPFGYPDEERSTTLLPLGLGRALLITNTTMITIERIQMVGGNAAGLGGAALPNAGGNLLYAATNGLFMHVDFYEGTATYGGALYNAGGTLRLADSWNSNNTALAYGGALYNASGTVTVTVIGSGNATVAGSWYRNNQAGQRGGAIYVAGGTVALEDSQSEYSNNSAPNGGAMYVAPGGTARISAGTFYTNTASQSGGALYNAGTLEMGGTTFKDNLAIQDGGALYNTGTASLDLGNRFYWNRAERNGGAIYAGGIFNALRNNVIYINTAQRGGALYVAAGAPNIWHNTFHQNTASVQGGAIYVGAGAGSALQIKNNIFSENSAPEGKAIFSSRGQLDYNDYWPEAAVNQVVGGAGIGSNNFNADPLYVKPQVTNLFAGDFHLKNTSPLIDVGTNLGVTRDMDNEPRPSNARPDIGADEVMNCLVMNVRLNTLYGQISTALNAADDNDVLRIAEGVCYENLVLNKPITLDGSWDKGFTSKLEYIATAIDGQNLGRTVRVSGGNVLLRDLVIRKGSIQGNGGGILVESGSTLMLYNARVTDNQATSHGAGLYVASGATADLVDVGFYDNIAQGDGGGLYLADGSSASLLGLGAYRNTALRGGGGFIAPTAVVNAFKSSVFQQNTAQTQGGGLYNALANLKLINTRFYQNTAQDGAGIYNTGNTLRVLHSTLHENAAMQKGGALYNLGAGTVVSASIVASNTAGVSGAGIYGALTVNLDYTLRWANDFYQATGPHTLEANPRFLPNSGHLLYTSPAIDAVPDAASEVSYDYQGVYRPQLCAKDMGYREYYVSKRLLSWVDTPNPPLGLTDAGQPFTTTFSLTNLNEYWLVYNDPRTTLGPGTGYTETIQVALTTLQFGWSRIVKVENAGNVTIAPNGRSAGFGLGPGKTAVIYVVTTPPPGTLANIEDRIKLDVTASLCDRDPLTLSSLQATVRVREDFSFQIGPDNFGVALPGQTITYTHRITNTGNLTHSFTLLPKAGFYGVGRIISPASELLPLQLGPGESYPITVAVTINREAAGGLVDVTGVVGINKDNGAQRAAANNTTISYTTGIRYVATTGLDSLVNETIGSQDPNAVDLPDNNCTQPATAPCRSLTHALQQAAPGDEIRIATGSYTDVMSTTYQSAVITQTLFVNKAVTLRGGFDSADWSSTDLITPTTIFNPQGKGRGLYIPAGVTVHVDRIAFTGGSADAGGALYNAGTLKLTNSLFYANTAATGAALYNRGSLTAWNNTFYANSAGSGFGGAIYVLDGSAAIRNTIFANNTAANGSALYRAGGTVALDYNLYWQNVVAGASTGANDKVNVDPQFVNVGATPPNVRLRSTSPARDAGDPATDFSTFPRDLGNASRRMGPRVDMGAYEYVILIGARLTPDYTRVLPKGTVITYTHTLTNTGEMTDTFTLSFSSSLGWGQLLTPGPLTLPAGATAQVQVRVTVPTGNVGGLQDTSIVTATSQSDPTKAAWAVDKTTAEFIPGVSFVPNRNTPDATPGSAIVYEHTLTNTGDGQDTFVLSYESTQGWASAPVPAQVTLGAGMSTTVRITITVPTGALQGVQDTTRITATSTFSPAVKAAVVDVTSVGGAAGLQLTPTTQQAVVSSGAPFTYTFTVTNTGNAPDTIVFTAQSSLGWSYTILPPSVTLNAGASAQVKLVLSVPAASGGQTDVTTLTASSTATPGLTRQATVTSLVQPQAGVTLTPASQSKAGQAGTTLSYTYTVANTGNAPAAITLEASNDRGWTVTVNPTVIASLTPGGNQSVVVQVTLPVGATGNARTAITATASVPNAPLARAFAEALSSIPLPGGPQLEPDYPNGQAAPGGTAVYAHTLTNTGTVPDTYTLSYHSSQGWSMTFDPAGPITLEPGASRTVLATLSVPASATPGTVDTTVITATAQSNPARYDTATDITTIVANVAPVLDPDYARSLKRGESTIYTHTLTNPGSAAQTYQISLNSSRGWATLLTPAQVTVPAGGSSSVSVRVTVPGSGVTPGMQEVTTVRATVQGAPTLYDEATDTTTVLPSAGLLFAPNRSASGDPGTVITYTHTLTNTGDVQDTFSFNATSALGWPVSLPAPVTLAPGASATVQVRVTIPAYTPGGTVETTVIRATSQYDPAVSQSVTDTTTVNTLRAFVVAPLAATRSAKPGHTMVQTLTVTNTGNIADTYLLALNDLPAGWASLTPNTPFNLAPGATKVLTLSVNVPSDATNGDEHSSFVMVTSQGDLNLSETAEITTLIVATPGVSMTPDRSGQRQAGQSISYLHTITNTGSARDVFNLRAVSAHGWPVEAPATVILNAGERKNIIVTLTIPQDVISGTVDVLTITASSDADASVSASVQDTTTVLRRVSLDFTPAWQEKWTDPQQPVVYTHVLTNTGNYTDTFDLSFSSQRGWVTGITPASVTLGMGEAAEVRVTVTPGLGSGGLSDTALITATSRANAAVSKVVQDVTRVRFTPGVALSPGIQRTATQSEVVTYTHTITNTGTGLDTYTLTASSSQGWAILFPPPASLTLAAGEASTFSVVIKVPQTAYSGTLDILTITARSQTYTTTVATAQDRTLVQGTPSFKLYLPVIYRGYPKDGVDLVVTGIEIGPVKSGEPTLITVTTQNIGNRPVAYGNNFYVDLYIFFEDPYMPPPLVAGQIYWGVQGHWYAPGEVVKLTGVYTFPVSAEWIFYAQIDTDLHVEERDETNNVYGPLRRYLAPGAIQGLSPSAIRPQIPRPVPLTEPRPVPPLQP